jgi:hypothetical protein
MTSERGEPRVRQTFAEFEEVETRACLYEREPRSAKTVVFQMSEIRRDNDDENVNSS